VYVRLKVLGYFSSDSNSNLTILIDHFLFMPAAFAVARFQ